MASTKQIVLSDIHHEAQLNHRLARLAVLGTGIGNEMISVDLSAAEFVATECVLQHGQLMFCHNRYLPLFDEPDSQFAGRLSGPHFDLEFREPLAFVIPAIPPRHFVFDRAAGADHH
jgi:hypothetical protein